MRPHANWWRWSDPSEGGPQYLPTRDSKRLAELIQRRGL